MGVVATLVAGVAFGLALAAPPGPMNAVIAEESVVRGWVAGFRAGLGAMTADLCFFALALLGVVTLLVDRPRLRAAMVAVGGLIMLWFAYGAARDARAATRPEAGTTGPGRGFRKALILALTNPYQVLFWLTVGVGLLQPGTTDLLALTPYVGADLAGVLVIETGSPALVVGLFGGVLAWIVAFPAALVAAERRVASVGPAVAGLSAVVLALAGVSFLLDAAGTLLA